MNACPYCATRLVGRGVVECRGCGSLVSLGSDIEIADVVNREEARVKFCERPPNVKAAFDFLAWRKPFAPARPAFALHQVGRAA